MTISKRDEEIWREAMRKADAIRAKWNATPRDKETRERYLNRYKEWLASKPEHVEHIIHSPKEQSSRIMLSCSLGSFNYAFGWNVPTCEHEPNMREMHTYIAETYNNGIPFIENFVTK